MITAISGRAVTVRQIMATIMFFLEIYCESDGDVLIENIQAKGANVEIHWR